MKIVTMQNGNSIIGVKSVDMEAMKRKGWHVVSGDDESPSTPLVNSVSPGVTDTTTKRYFKR